MGLVIGRTLDIRTDVAENREPRRTESSLHRSPYGEAEHFEPDDCRAVRGAPGLRRASPRSRGGGQRCRGG
jgi:hypothetical protein